VGVCEWRARYRVSGSEETRANPSACGAPWVTPAGEAVSTREDEVAQGVIQGRSCVSGWLVISRGNWWSARPLPGYHQQPDSEPSKPTHRR